MGRRSSLFAVVAAGVLFANAAAFELWIGATDLSATNPEMKWVKRDWMDGFTVDLFRGNPSAAQVAAKAAQGFTMVGQTHANIDTYQRQSTTQPTAQCSTALIRDFVLATNQSALWMSLIEDDSSGVGFPQEQMAKGKAQSHAAAYDALTEYLVIAMIGFSGSAHAYAVSGGVQMLMVERANDDVADLPTAMAFVRGAARQFGLQFGVDLSWWWGAIYGGANRVHPSYHRRIAYAAYIGGSSAINIEGGNGLIDGNGQPLALGQEMQKFGEFVHSQKKRTNLASQQGTSNLEAAWTPSTPVCLIVPKDLGYETKSYWSTQNTAWQYLGLRPRQGDNAVQSFFEWAFPGSSHVADAFPFGTYYENPLDPPSSPFAMSAVQPPFAPRATDVFFAPAFVPFGRFPNRTAASAAFSGPNPPDSAPYRPMADTRFGDIIDVRVTEEYGLRNLAVSHGQFALPEQSPPQRIHVPAQPLNASQYKVAILLGAINMTAPLIEELTAFAEDGGTVIVSAGVVGPSHGTFTGVTMLPELRVGRGWTATGIGHNTELYRFCPVTKVCTVCTVLATVGAGAARQQNRLHSDARWPLVVAKTVGKGRIVTTLVPWMLGAGAHDLAQLSKALLASEFQRVQPATVLSADHSAANVQYTHSVDASGKRLVLVANHDESNFTGVVTFQNATQAVGCVPTAWDVLSGERMKRTAAVAKQKLASFAVEIVVAAFDVKLVELRGC